MVKQGTKIHDKKESEREQIYQEFTALVFTLLRQTHELDGFRQWMNEVLQKQLTQRASTLAQLEEIAIQQEAMLKQCSPSEPISISKSKRHRQRMRQLMVKHPNEVCTGSSRYRAPMHPFAET